MRLLNYAEIQWRNGAPFSSHYDDIFYNPNNGFAESDHTFIVGNDLLNRFQALKEDTHFTIGEIGFGSGLNFINSANHFLNKAPKQSKLYYISCEKNPWRCQDLEDLQYSWPCNEIRHNLYRYYPQRHAGFHQLHVHPRISLLLLWGDIAETLPQLQARVDAWFLDGFAPSKNPECWQKNICEQLSRCSHTQTTAATFSAARAVRDALTAAGFSVQKRRGYGPKRDMLTAICEQPISSPVFWTDPPEPHPVGQVAVIGAGIAGSATARALAESGRKVTLYHDSQKHPAASNVPLAVPYFQPSREDTIERRYQLSAWHSAMRHYQNYSSHLTSYPVYCDGDTVKNQALLDEYILEDDEWQLDNEGRLLFNQIGALNFQQLCQSLQQHSNISLREDTVTDMNYSNEHGWQINGQHYSHVVICSGWQTDLFPDPILRQAIKPLRGQATFFACQTPPAQILCADHTIIPDPSNQQVYCGASYQPNDTDLRARTDDDKANLEALKYHYPNLAIGAEHSFVGIRGASRDYLPLVGPVTKLTSAQQRYRKWSYDANAPVHAALDHYPGLYIHAGLGSKGATHAFLNAEIITALINNTPLPIAREIMAHLLPTRFTMRAIIRRKV